MTADRFPAVLPFPAPAAPPTPIVPRPERFSLDNGLRVVAIARRDLPQVAARLVIPAGSAADPSGRPGVAAMTAAVLTEGTLDRSAVDLNERIDRLGATIGARAGHDFTEIDLVALAETLAESLALVGEILTAPAFPPREFDRVRAESLDALEARLDEPANVADDRTALAVFGPDHPYGRLSIGTPDGLQSIRRSDLVGFHGKRYRPAGSVLIVAGDFDHLELRRALDRAFGGWTGSVDPIDYPVEPARAHAAGRLEAVDWGDGAQGEIRFAGIGLPRDSEDWIDAAVANYILGGSTITGRLGANLREDKGWTYGVRSSFCAGRQAAGWTVETAVDADATPDAIAEIERELRRISTEPVAEEELERAKEALVLSLPRAFETPARIVARLATLEAFGLPADYWERFPAKVGQVTVDSVLRIAQRQFEPGGLARVAVRPAGTG